MEGKLWKVGWKRAGKQYSLSLLEHPKICAQGAVLAEVIEQLEDLVSDRLGDAMPHFEYLTPLPEEGSNGRSAFVYTLAGHKRLDCIINLDRLFVRGECRTCGNYSGPRTDELLRLDSVPEGDLSFTGYIGQVISRELAQFLNLPVAGEIETRPVIIGEKETSDFLELRSLRPRPFVASKEFKKARWGSKCKTCGLEVWMYMPYEASFKEYISEADISTNPGSVYPIGVDERMRLVVSRKIHGEVIRSNRFKNVVSSRIGVLPVESAIPIVSFFAGGMER